MSTTRPTATTARVGTRKRSAMLAPQGTWRWSAERKGRGAKPACLTNGMPWTRCSVAETAKAIGTERKFMTMGGATNGKSERVCIKAVSP